jgi:hypothetical protein
MHGTYTVKFYLLWHDLYYLYYWDGPSLTACYTVQC